MDPQPSAPPVVAVVVTCDPGEWFEQALASLADQDYPNLSVLIVDAASLVDPTPRVASVIPHAFVRRLSERVGFARAANDVLDVVEGASHFLFCHDDVALAPDAVRLMVEEAFRSNAGVVCPKMVDWDRPERLISVGANADRLGGTHRLVERGELDQEQHDAVRDVFVAPGGATLIRSDLFTALGGYDSDVDLFGDDVNLSWRAHLVGARVIVAPDARVRHIEAIAEHRRAGWTGSVAAQRIYAAGETHRVRNVLTCASASHLLWLVPAGIVLSAVHAAWLLVSGHGRAAGATVAAWPRALRGFGQLRQSRQLIQRQRTVPDADIRRLQLGSRARIRGMLSDRLHAGVALAVGASEAAAAGDLAPPSVRDRRDDEGGGRRRWLAPSEPDGLASGSSIVRGWREPAALAAVLAVVLIIGTRSLIFGHIPGIGQLPVTTDGPSQWWHLFFSGYRPDGLGSAAPAPPALAFLGFGGTVLLGAVALLQHLVVLGPLVIGPFGMWRAARAFGSSRGRVAAVVVYAAVPVPYNALANGHWGGLLVYAVAPWVLLALARASGDVPFTGQGRTVFGVPPGRLLGLGIGLAVLAAFVPAALFAVPFVALAMAIGALPSRGGRGAWRTVIVAFGASVLAVILLYPWSLDVLSSRTAIFGVQTSPAARLGLGSVLRFHTGPLGSSPLDWGFVAAAALPLLLGRSWRLAWATRLWAVALACWGLVWMASRGWVPIPMPAPEVFLALAAAALALSTALGVVAFELDLPGYQFGWRQLASAFAALAVAAGVLPMLGAATGGRWHLPTSDESSQLSLPGTKAGNYRILWMGDPSALPLGSWSFEKGVGYATSQDGMPDLTNLWPASHKGATGLLATDVRLARDRQTTQLGHLLAPMGVRYIIIPNQNAPAGAGGVSVPTPVDVEAGLAFQLDLRVEQVDSSLTVYENAAWSPVRAVLPPSAGPSVASANPRLLVNTDLTSSRPVLTSGGSLRGVGAVPSGRIYVGVTNSSLWKLSVNGRSAPRQPAFGWAESFSAPTAGQATLVAVTSGTRVLQLLCELVFWLAAVVGLVAFRRSAKRRRGRSTPIDPAWFEPLGPPEGNRARRARTAARRASQESDDTDSEMWADG